MYHLLAIHILSKALNFVLHHSTETTSDDNTLDASDDGFFTSGSSSDEEADGELTDKSTAYGS